MEGRFAVKAWIPKETEVKDLKDTLTIYDAGNIQGFLIKLASGKTTWFVFQVDYRLVQEDGTIVEGCEVLPESSAPLHYLSIETYPLKQDILEGTHILWSIPKFQVLLTTNK